LKIKSIQTIVIAFLAFVVLAHGSEKDTGKTTGPATIYLDGKVLHQSKTKIKNGDEAALKSLNTLVERADAQLQKGPFSVTNKTTVPPSGIKHDYLSLGIYWWPNPDTEDGLPYIRKDGYVNPEISKFDLPSNRNMRNGVSTLALAYYFTDNEKYAAHAIELLKVWFLDDETKMNPNLKFGQAIPGIVEGRGIGIIETAHYGDIVDAILLLESSKHWKEQYSVQLKKWFKDYLQWLLASTHGIEEQRWHNNHGTWFDAQVIHYALFTGEDDIAQSFLNTVAKLRINSQIQPDGEQPYETARTKSFSYSAMNLIGFFTLARLGEHKSVDLWTYKSDDGRTIRGALNYLTPFATGEKEWKYQMVNGWDKAYKGLATLLKIASVKYNNPEYIDILHNIKTDIEDASIENLTIGPLARIEPDTIVEYKRIDDVKLNLHIFNPPNHTFADKRPAIVFFFGGGWKGYRPKHFYNQSKYLASRGMVTICAEYRTENEHKTPPKECVKDGKSAIRWIRSHAAVLGIDPDKLAAGGGSAGGHVAAATGTIKGFNENGEDTTISCRPNALVLFNPVFDNGPNGYGHDRVKEYWKEFSPLHNIDKNVPPTIVLLGTKDRLIPVATTEKYKEQMEKHGVRCDLHLYKDQKHGFFNSTKYYETLLEADKFLSSLGYLTGKPTLQKR